MGEKKVTYMISLLKLSLSHVGREEGLALGEGGKGIS